MKKLVCTALAAFVATLLPSCGSTSAPAEEEFKPALDVTTKCDIKVIGDYKNFEALEAEFDRFNEFYPDVELTYKYVDDYKNLLGTVLDGTDNPNIFFSYTWMMGNEKYSSVVGHMEDLSDPALKMDLNCIRPNLLSKDDQGKSYMVPVFSRTYGMLVNEDLFKKGTLWVQVIPNCHKY